VSARGEAAITAATELVERAAAAGPHPDGPIWDAWSSAAEPHLHGKLAAKATATGNR
jgi:hypothetical protein